MAVGLGAMGLCAAGGACSFDLDDVATPDDGSGGVVSTYATTSSTTTTTGSGGSMITSSSAGGAGGGVGGSGAAGGGGGGPTVEGCSDGTREAYTNAVMEPNIAGCAGGWTVPGVRSAESMITHCGRNSGNTSVNPNGAGCSVEDLCDDGWHVCDSMGDVALKSTNQSCPPDTGQRRFWATRQGMNIQQPGEQVYCVAAGNNNVYGCSDSGTPLFGGTDDNDNCDPLERGIGANDCVETWACTGPDDEALNITKSGPDFGGVLCCRD